MNSDSSATPSNGTKRSASPNMSVISTTPPKRFHKVRNPFEGPLTERLHLPLIESPSLFRYRSGPPPPPQLCSPQFEWDIEDISRLQPVHIEPHESQFQDSPDPELESKAQLAISKFFQESHIAPSPVDCPLRSQRIILSEIDDNTAISSSKIIDSRHIRNCEVQTELTLPPILPFELEEALRPYFQPHLADSMTVQNESFNCSMRRELFDLHNVIVLSETDEKPPQMVGSSPHAKQTLIAGRLSESDSEFAACSDCSFDCISPIRNLCGLTAGTPDDGNGSQSARKRKKLLHELELLSPIAPSEHLSRRRQNRSSYRELSNNNNNHSTHVTPSEMTGHFTSDRSSSPVQGLENTSSTDRSINKRVSRLRVNSLSRMENKSHHMEETELTSFDDDDDDEDGDADGGGGGGDVEEEDDDMQLSSLSINCSSTNSDTPRSHRHRRSAIPRNLSQSFIFNTDDISSDGEGEQPIGEDVVSATAMATTTSGYPEYVACYRTDSGFNETCSTSTFALSQEQPLAATMASCQGSEDEMSNSVDV